MKLTYQREAISNVDSFTDFDWGNIWSTTGLLAQYNRVIIIWCSRQQETIALPNAEAKYNAASEVTMELIYLRNLVDITGFTEIGLFGENNTG